MSEKEDDQEREQKYLVLLEEHAGARPHVALDAVAGAVVRHHRSRHLAPRLLEFDMKMSGHERKLRAMKRQRQEDLPTNLMM